MEGEGGREEGGGRGEGGRREGGRREGEGREGGEKREEGGEGGDGRWEESNTYTHTFILSIDGREWIPNVPHVPKPVAPT